MKTTFLSLLLLLTGSVCFAQLDTMRPPYQRYPTVPALYLLLQDSSTKYTKADLPKKKPLLIVLFSPDCEHCQQEAEQMVTRKEDFKDIHVVMATTYPLHRMNEFAKKNGLTTMKNVVVAKDQHYLLPPFFNIRNYPFMALYNKNGNLIKTLEGAVGTEKILAAFKQTD